jgi:hypothetical protein
VIEEEITVYATRADARLQDSPAREEEFGSAEIEEKTMMTDPTTIQVSAGSTAAGLKRTPSKRTNPSWMPITSNRRPCAIAVT